MKEFIEQYGLNLLGDTVAGFLGLATFIVVIFTYFAQRRLAIQTVEEMKQQNRLGAAIASANYKMDLFDKRREAYEHFINARMRFVVESGKDMGVIEAIENALSSAKFVYDQDMNYRLLELSKQASALHIMAQVHDAKAVKNSEGRLTKKEQEQFEKEFEQFDELSKMLFKNLFDQELMEMFYTRLKLPEEIVVGDGSAIKQ